MNDLRRDVCGSCDDPQSKKEGCCAGQCTATTNRRLEDLIRAKFKSGNSSQLDRITLKREELSGILTPP